MHGALGYGLHRLTCSLWIARAAEDRPALRHGVDLTFRIDLRAERISAIEVGTPIPLAVPPVLFDAFLEFPCLSQATIRKAYIVVPARQFGEPRQHVVKEESQPDAFASAFYSYQIHSVIPIAASHKRQAMHAEFQSVFDGANAMFVQRAGLVRAIWQIIVRFLLWL